VDCAPALFTLAGGYTIATNVDGKLLTPDAPAHPGDIIVIYLTGSDALQANRFPARSRGLPIRSSRSFRSR